MTCPTDGYVVAMATAEAQATHNNATFTQSRYSVSETSGTPGSHYTTFNVSANAPTGSYSAPVAVQAVFPVTAGAHSFYFVGTANSLDVDVMQRSLTVMFFPTAYGTVTGALKADAARTADDPAADAAREPVDASRVASERIERELRAMQARFDQLRAELEAARAVQRAEVATRAEVR